jgi:MFS family permease
MSADSTLRAGRREWIGLAVLNLAAVVYAMDLTVLHLAVPSLSADLEPTSVQLLWIVDIYGFVVAGALITMGTLGDRIGRRRLLLIGAAAFGVASVLTAFSTSWGSVFLLAVPVMVLLLALGPVLLPEFRDPDAGRLDLVSAGQSLIAVLAVIYGLQQIAQDGLSWPPLLAIVAGLQSARRSCVDRRGSPTR